MKEESERREEQLESQTFNLGGLKFVASLGTSGYFKMEDCVLLEATGPSDLWRGAVTLNSTFIDWQVLELKDIIQLFHYAHSNQFCFSFSLDQSGDDLRLSIVRSAGFRNETYTVKLDRVKDPLERGLRILERRVNMLADGQFKFDATTCSSNLQLFHNDTAVIYYTGRSDANSHAGVFTKGYKEGVVYYEFRVIQTIKGAMLIGVTNKKERAYPGSSNEFGQSYYLYDGCVRKNGKEIKYGINSITQRPIVGAGGYVGILLNLSTKKVRWSLNGVRGQEWDLPMVDYGDSWYISVNSHSEYDAIEIVPQHCYHQES